MPRRAQFVGPLALAALLVGCGGGGGSSDGSSIAPDFPSVEACITGPWLLVADQAQRAFTGSLPSGVSLSLTGQATVDIAADGTYTYKPDFTVNFQTPAGPAQGRLRGTTKGTWAVSGSTLTTTETSNNITGVATGSFGSVPIPNAGGFSSMQSTLLACTPAYFDYEVQATSGNFTQRLVGN